MADLALAGPGGAFTADVRVPGDKSLSHRALLFAGMAAGDSVINGLGTGVDIASTAGALISLGVSISGTAGVEHRVQSPGIAAWQTPTNGIDCGNSGTTMRLLAGILATSHVATSLDGDDSLRKRPMERLVPPLHALGGVIATHDGTPPISVGGATEVHGANVTIPMASAQVRSAFALGALAASGPSTIDSPPGFRDHTERWLSAVGLGEWETDTRFRIDPGAIPPARFDVPGDPSSAAFLWTCAAIHPGSTITTPGISLNPGRLGFLEILSQMGVVVEAEVTGDTGGDPVGTVTVHGGSLHATEVSGDLVAAALDELPLVAVLGAYAEGITSVRDASELRGKESDRIAAVVEMIRSTGGGADERPDGFDVVGTGFLEGGTVGTHHDHRIAMSAAVAATRAQGTVVIEDADVAAVSWPGFYATLEGLWS